MKIWEIFAGLGVPGLAIGTLYMLFRQFHWKLPTVPKSWTGPLLLTFMLIVGGVVFYTLHIWAPNKSIDNNTYKKTKRDLWVRITSQNVIYHTIRQDSSDKDYLVVSDGKVTGIVSDPASHVYLLIRRFNRPQFLKSSEQWIPEKYWGIKEAVVKAGGDWEGIICDYPEIEHNTPDYGYWELMAIATYDKNKIDSEIVWQTCGINHSNILIIGNTDNTSCSETVISMRPPISKKGYYIDKSLAPKETTYCVY
ncbi:hypothetical protein [Candidatus Electronema sp. JM]|uniref:hypothetical protein n=1 Tax=Candidatus Electronema sp. JM TaxID=3401571 RepID=UPI003AA88389